MVNVGSGANVLEDACKRSKHLAISSAIQLLALVAGRAFRALNVSTAHLPAYGIGRTWIPLSL